MPKPSQPCDGKLSPETQKLLGGNRDRARWGVYPCAVCGRLVGVEQVSGAWIPERHWPSVVYAPRDKAGRIVKPARDEERIERPAHLSTP